MNDRVNQGYYETMIGYRRQERATSRNHWLGNRIYKGPVKVKSTDYLGNCMCSFSWSKEREKEGEESRMKHRAVRVRRLGTKIAVRWKWQLGGHRMAGNENKRTDWKTSGGKTQAQHTPFPGSVSSLCLICIGYNQSGLRDCPGEETRHIKREIKTG